MKILTDEFVNQFIDEQFDFRRWITPATAFIFVIYLMDVLVIQSLAIFGAVQLLSTRAEFDEKTVLGFATRIVVDAHPVLAIWVPLLFIVMMMVSTSLHIIAKKRKKVSG